MPGEIKRITEVDPHKIEWWVPYLLPELSTSEIDAKEIIRKIPPGWLITAYTNVGHAINHPEQYAVIDCSYGWDWRISSVFIPDPKHKIDWRQE